MRYILFICFQLIWLQSVFAGVTMAGTRVIFPAENSDKTLQFTNNTPQPFFVQLWISKPSDSSNDVVSSDFTFNPQFFRMNGKTGQAVRLLFTSTKDLPKDRESLFYLNFKQIPALEKENQDQNKLVLIVSSKFKILYRPKTILSKIEDLPSSLNYRIDHIGKKSYLTIYNPTGYFANLTQVFVNYAGKNQEINQVDMIPPFSSKQWDIGNTVNKSDISEVSMTYINDYGAYLKYKINEKL